MWSASPANRRSGAAVSSTCGAGPRRFWPVWTACSGRRNAKWRRATGLSPTRGRRKRCALKPGPSLRRWTDGKPPDVWRFKSAGSGSSTNPVPWWRRGFPPTRAFESPAGSVGQSPHWRSCRVRAAAFEQAAFGPPCPISSCERLVLRPPMGRACGERKRRQAA